jgi:hypothetical protein
MDPLHITEFATERYFSKLRKLNENSENASSSSSVVPTAVSATPSLLSSTFTLPLGNPPLQDSNAFPTPPGIRDRKKKSLVHDLTALRAKRRPTYSGSFGSLKSNVTVVHKTPSIVKYYESIVDIKHRDNLNKCVYF